MTKWLTIAILAAMACGPQQFRDITQAPMEIDPNQIAVDPASGARLCLGWGRVELGKPFSIQLPYCDPESDPMAFVPHEWLSVGPETFMISAQPTSIGVYYYTVSATDEPGAGRTPKTRTGTFVLAVEPVNQAPVFGCASAH